MNCDVLGIRSVAYDDARKGATVQRPRSDEAIVAPRGACGATRPRLGRRQRETHRRKYGWRSLASGMPRRPTLLTAAALLAIACGLAACGRSDRVAAQASDLSVQLRPPTAPEAVLVRVGSDPITGAMVDDLLRAEQDHPDGEQLDPPAFIACVAHVRSESATLGTSTPGTPQLRRECQTRYEEALRTALERLIADEWLVEGAREAGAPVGDVSSPLATRAKLAAAAIRRMVTNGVRPVTSQQIAQYYELHRYEYLLGGERDLMIVRTMTQAAAAKAKAEIESGKSFASVAKKQPVTQPVDSLEGLVLELHPGYYGEPRLNEAIFTSKPGVLVGPVGTWFGQFVFEVTKIVSEREKPLARVQASIRAQLTKPLQENAVAAFLTHWRATWSARTDCDPGAIVPGCRQSKEPLVASLAGAPAPD
jgi:hypothetical protein